VTGPRRIRLEVNGRPVELDVEHRVLLSDLLRDTLGLTGTHVGCEHGVCGACTVLLDGAAVRSCLLLAVAADGCRIETVEGLAATGASPLPDALSRHQALQCGFCTAGFLVLGESWLRRGPDREPARDAVASNLCRCTGYAGLVRAFEDAAEVHDSST
jgi:aerobic-type carbon monoxide dehydrogenase small subunit (CoxS/CutS family)